MRKTQNDDLAALLEELQAWASRQQVLLVSGHLSQAGGLPKIRFHADPPEAGARFIEALEKTNARLVTYVETRLDLETFEDGIADLSDANAPDAALASARACQNRIGNLAALTVRAICTEPPAVLCIEHVSPWFELFYTDAFRRPAATEGSPENEEWERLRKERNEWSRGERRTKAARVLAAEPRFPACKTEAARVHLLSLILGEELPSDEYLLKEITREARAIYELEIRPSTR